MTGTSFAVARSLEPEDLSQRTLVWTALAELFVDCEPYPMDFERIARTIAGAGFTSAEGKTILRNEVAPVFWWNLWSPAGEWIPWNEQQVTEMVLRYLNRPPWWYRIGFLREWIRNQAFDVVVENWLKIEMHLSECPRNSTARD